MQIPDQSLATERDVFLYRSYIAQRKYRIVMDEIKPSSSPLLHPLKMLAEFLAAPAAKRESLVLEASVF